MADWWLRREEEDEEEGPKTKEAKGMEKKRRKKRMNGPENEFSTFRLGRPGLLFDGIQSGGAVSRSDEDGNGLAQRSLRVLWFFRLADDGQRLATDEERLSVLSFFFSPSLSSSLRIWCDYRALIHFQEDTRDLSHKPPGPFSWTICRAELRPAFNSLVNHKVLARVQKMTARRGGSVKWI